MINVGIYIYDHAEVLDFSGPFEVFSTAHRLAGDPGLFNVFLVAESLSPVQARGGYSVMPHYSVQTAPNVDLLIVVGGVHLAEMKKALVMDWITKAAAEAQWVTSVCTGAFLLAQAEVFTDQVVTTHWEDIDALEAQFPRLRVKRNVRWVEQGRFVSSAGISAGIDMSLHMVQKLHSQILADTTARQMDYHWDKQHGLTWLED